MVVVAVLVLGFFILTGAGLLTYMAVTMHRAPDESPGPYAEIRNRPGR